MKNLFVKSVLTSVLVALSISALHANELPEKDQFTGNVRGYLGSKTMDDNDWGTLDEHGAIGVMFDIKKKSWPISIVVDVVGSGDVNEIGALKNEGYTAETRIGVRKTFNNDGSSFHPYVGGGVVMTYAEMKNKDAGVVTSKDDDTATGTWVGAGMYYAVNDHFNVGFDVSYSESEVTLFNVDRKAGGVHSGITAGYHW